MATIIVRQTELLTKKGKKIILEEDTYLFCEELWGLIKEFAGIYNFRINWGAKFSAQPTFFREFIEFRYSDDSAPMPMTKLKGEECFLRRQLFKKLNDGKLKSGWYYANEGDEDKTKMVPTKKMVLKWLENNWGIFRLPKEFKVGDEIQFCRGEYANDQHYRAGIITQISADRGSYKIREYTAVKLGLSPDYDNTYNQYFRYGWDKNDTKMTTIKSDKGIKKECREYIYTLWYN